MLLRDGWEYTEGFMNVTKFMEILSNIVSLSWGTNWQYFSIGSALGFMLNLLEAIIWKYKEYFLTSCMALQDHSEL